MEEITVEVAMEAPTPVEVVVEVLVLTGGVIKCISPVAELPVKLPT
jgi:hypothetical protein